MPDDYQRNKASDESGGASDDSADEGLRRSLESIGRTDARPQVDIARRAMLSIRQRSVFLSALNEVFQSMFVAIVGLANIVSMDFGQTETSRGDKRER